MGRIIDSYKEILLAFIYFIVTAVIITAAGFAIVTPLWYAATYLKTIYTIIIGTAFLFLLIFFIAGSLQKNMSFKKNLFIFFWNTLLFLTVIMFGFSFIILAGNRLYLQLFLVTFFFFLVSGILRFYKRG